MTATYRGMRCLHIYKILSIRRSRSDNGSLKLTLDPYDPLDYCQLCDVEFELPILLSFTTRCIHAHALRTFRALIGCKLSSIQRHLPH